MQKLSKKNYTKIGILGGTFDPPHFGHVEICKIAIKKLKLKKVFWIATNKLHPRGPIGLDQLTTYKYILEGKGQIRK